LLIMKVTRIFFYIVFVCLALPREVKSQHETSKWYFGGLSALDFISGSPVALGNSAMFASEGCSSISDPAGNLLSYTNGLEVYNQAHQLMANGSSLFGSASTSQSSLIVKKPLSTQIYYLFTLEELPQGRLSYSEIDMSLAAGMGSVTVKNVVLASGLTEKLSGTMHCNGTDIWITTHQFGSSDFYSFLVTASGVSVSPVISTAGTSHGSPGSTGTSAIGCMKFSPTGKKLGLSVTSPLNLVEVFDFDNASGLVSNPLHLGTLQGAYGCEFSPDGTKFYASSSHLPLLKQWDLSAGSASVILASEYSLTDTCNGFLGMQSASDGKIYLMRTKHPAVPMGVIHHPNLNGQAFNYGQMSIPLLAAGLPNFMSSYFLEYPVLSASVHCSTSTFSVQLPVFVSGLGRQVTGIQWNFGDPLSGVANTSTVLNASHMYSAAGTYTAILTVNYDCSSDHIPVTVTIDLPNLTVTGNHTVCAGSSLILTASGADTYSWSTGHQGATVSMIPTASFVYTLSGTNALTGCSAHKTVSVIYSQCLGLNTASESPGVRIYPNPLKDFLTVETLTSEHIQVCDLFGKLLFEQTITEGSTQIDLRQWPAGVYFVKLGHKTAKLIKEDL
jgi:hypothetical protein